MKPTKRIQSAAQRAATNTVSHVAGGWPLTREEVHTVSVSVGDVGLGFTARELASLDAVARARGALLLTMRVVTLGPELSDPQFLAQLAAAAARQGVRDSSR